MENLHIVTFLQRSSWQVLILGAVALCLIARLFTTSFSRLNAKRFVNDEGIPMKELKVDDLRFKLLKSSQISHQGRALAGSEPFLIRSGNFQEVVISQPDHIHEFYRSDHKAHGKPRNFNFGELFGRFMGSAVGLRYGEEWRKIRQHFDPPFKFYEAAQQAGRFEREIALWIEDLTRSSTSDLKSRSAFKYLIFRLMAVHLYRDAFDDRLYWQMIELSHLHDEVVHDLMVCKSHGSKFWSMVPTTSRNRVDRFLSGWRSLNRGIINNARGGGWDCPVETIARGADDTNDMTEEDFLSTLGEILFANVDVSASVLSTIFTNLAANPAIQNELRSEITRWRSEEKVDIAQYLTNPKSLLHRVAMESMRLSPAFWFSMPEDTAEDKKIGGYHVPANTTVIIDNRRLNEEAVTWGPDGEQFRPDRFLEVAPQALRCGFMRFGTGAASGRCLGKHIADVLFKLTTIAVVENFALEPLKSPEKSDFMSSGQGTADVRFIRL